jgi:hypothetical protein
MMIDVHMKDGHTVFRLRKRGMLVDLVQRDPTKIEADQGLACWVRWHPENEFVPCRMMNINKSSIAFTREVAGVERAEFEAAR